MRKHIPTSPPPKKRVHSNPHNIWVGVHPPQKKPSTTRFFSLLKWIEAPKVDGKTASCAEKIWSKARAQKTGSSQGARRRSWTGSRSSRDSRICQKINDAKQMEKGDLVLRELQDQLFANEQLQRDLESRGLSSKHDFSGATGCKYLEYL